MKKIYILLFLTGLFAFTSLSAYAEYANPLIKLNEEEISGVVQIVNLPDNQIPGTTPSPGTDSDSTIPNNPNDKGTPKSPKSGDDDDDKVPPNGVGFGTGFIIEPNVIITNYHVIAGKNRHYVILGHNDLKHYASHLIIGDKDSDIAIMKIDEWDDFVNYVHPHILEWGDSRYLQQGQWVWALGHPYGLTWTLTDGIISSTLRADPEDANPNINNYYIQTNTSINPGNSGGPLFDMNGKVIGINTGIVGTKGFLGLAIPSYYAQKVIGDLENGGKVRYGKLGIVLGHDDNQHYIVAKAILKGSSVIDAGLLPNDKLLEIRTSKSEGWITINSIEILQYELMLLHPGDTVELNILRDKSEHKTLTCTLADADLFK